MEIKFKIAYERYLKYIINKRKIQSYNTLKDKTERNIIPHFSNFNIYNITEKDYIDWQNEIETCNYSNSYNNSLHYIMTNFFEFMIKYYGIKKNIPKLVGNFKQKQEIKQYNTYNIKQFKNFIKNIDNEIYKQFFNLLFFTGLRPGEAMALKFSDLNNKILYVNKTINEHGKREINSPKTLSSIRKIEIDRKLNRDLLKLKEKYSNYNQDYFIFGGSKPLAPTTINRYKIKACKKSNLIPIKLHEFRHSHATMLVEKKLMIKEVSRRLGHSNTNITLNTYTHTNKMQEKKVIKTLNFLRLFF